MNKELPLVSIIIPTYNRAKFFEERALTSALGQTYHNKEIIIVDDCSTDETPEVIKKYKDLPEIRPIRLSKNQGVAGARNVGINEAAGKYVVILDDDNELFLNFLEKTVPALESDEGYEYDAVSTGRFIKYKDFSDYAPARIGESGVESIDWGWLIRRSVFEQIQYDPNTYGDDDSDFGIQFFKKFRAIGINEPLQIAYDDESEAEKSVCFPSPRRLKAMEYFLWKNLDAYTDPNERRHLFRLVGRNYYRGGKRGKGVWYFWKSFMATKTPEAFLHFFFILFGWRVYNQFMTFEEKVVATVHKKSR